MKNVARMAAWVLAFGLLAFLCFWPPFAGMIAAVDDLKFVRGALNALPVTDALRTAWNTGGMFRPLEIIVAAGCNAQTLACPSVFPVQIVGLAVFAAGVVGVTRRIAPAHPIAVPFMLVWIALSPATMVSLWQMDTCSQTWCAAFAVWAGLFAWRAFESARDGRVDWVRWWVLMLLFAIALNIKEIFYGWSAGIGTALIIAVVSLWRSDRAAARRAALLLVPVVLLPMIHLAIRLKFGGLSGSGSAEDRYTVTLGGNLLVNGAVSLAGVFANGPLHLLGDDAAEPLLRVLSIASMLASLCVMAAAGGIRMLHRGTPAAVRGKPLLLVAGAAILSLTVTLPMGSISELYGLGANVGSGLLVVCALVSLWNPAAEDEQLVCRGIAVLGASVLLLVGCYGVVSRAYHFGITWEYARAMNDLVLEHQRSLPAGAFTPNGSIYVKPECFLGRSHNTYVVTPILSINAPETTPWLARKDPQRKITMSIESPLDPRPGLDIFVDCKSMPQRAHW